MNGKKDTKFAFSTRRRKNVEIDLEKEINAFIEVKRIERRSLKTLGTYLQALEQFNRWYKVTGQTSLNVETIRSYLHYLTEEKTKWDDHPTNHSNKIGISARSVNNIIRILRVFFNHMVREGIVTASPMDNVSYQRQQKETFEVFTDEDVEKLLSAPNRRTYTGLRDFCMMLVLTDCGLRIKEMSSLRLKDVNFKLRTITVSAEYAKNNTTRVVPISQKTTKELEKLISFMNVVPDDPLWLTQFGEQYFGDTFAKMLKKYAKKVGVKGPRVSPHTFRHYFAVKFLREGGNVVALARILGHSSLEMTQVYVRFVGSDLREQHDLASPVTSLIDKGNEKKRGNVRFK